MQSGIKNEFMLSFRYCGSGFNKTIISDRTTLNMILSSQTTSVSHHKRFLLTPSGSSHVHTGRRRFDVTFRLLKGMIVHFKYIVVCVLAF